MAKPYKLTPIELALSPKEHFEDNLDKFINNETIADDEKLILLQNALRRVNKHKPYREKPLKVNVIDQPSENSESFEMLKTLKKKFDSRVRVWGIPPPPQIFLKK